jgi:glycerol kinase
MLENVDGLRTRAEDGGIAFGTIDSWLVWNLTGGACHATDYSNASRTLMYNIGTLEWDSDIIHRLDIPRQILPEVKPSSHIYGETDPKVFFGRCVPIAGIAGDQQAALFGQACFNEGQAKNTYGTGSFVLMNTGAKPVSSGERLLTTIAWGIDGEPVEYALEGAIFATGAAIQWLRDGLGIISDAAETELMAASVENTGDVYFVPALAGLGAPHWDPYARGTIIGLTRGTTREHIARAALESICYQTRDVVEAMGAEAGIPLKNIRVDGGAVANAFLMQFQADILGVPIEVAGVTETTALGAAYLAGLATGFWESRGELESLRTEAQRYLPEMEIAERDRLYARWTEAVERSLGWVKERDVR